MSSWLVTGSGGMLGRELVELLRDRAELTALDRAGLDITDAGAVADAVADHDVVVNGAAWTDVDGAETAEDAATAVNGDGVARLAAACAKTGARLLHVSTDYVFAGDATSPYPEDAPTSPINAYGRSKLAGERAVLEALPDTGYVVRTAWLYAPEGRNFLTTILRLAQERETLTVVDDQQGQPTWSRALATRLVELGDAALTGRAPAGVYHGTASGATTWFGFAQAIFGAVGLDPRRVQPVASAQFPRPAPRPAYSVLGHGRWADAGLPPLAEWEPMLADAVAGIGRTAAATAARASRR